MSLFKKDGAYWLPRDMYPVYIGFVPNAEAWRRLVKRLGLELEPGSEYPSSSAATTRFHHKKSNGITLVVTLHEEMDSMSPAAICGALCHESVHVCQRIMQHIGEERPAMEQEAYLTEFVFKHMLEAYSKSRMK